MYVLLPIVAVLFTNAVGSITPTSPGPAQNLRCNKNVNCWLPVLVNLLKPDNIRCLHLFVETRTGNSFLDILSQNSWLYLSLNSFKLFKPLDTATGNLCKVFSGWLRAPSYEFGWLWCV